MNYASMAGGLEIFIDGAGFDFLANINTVLFESEDTECLVMSGTPMSCKCTFSTALASFDVKVWYFLLISLMA